MFKLEIQSSPQVIVLRCSGRVVRGDGADTLLRAVMSEDKRHILIDLNEVSAIDAAGLGTLAQLERWAKDGNRTLHLVNPSNRVRDALETTGLSSVLQIFPAVGEESASQRGVVRLESNEFALDIGYECR